MSWYKYSVRIRDFTIQKALRILGLNPGATESDIKKARNNLAKMYHSDKGGIDDSRMAEINVAFEFLEANGFRTGITTPSFEHGKSWKRQEEESVRGRGIPEWQTDFRSSNNDVGKDFCDLNFCKKSIWEEAIKNGEVEKYFIWPFDGNYFRNSFTVYANYNSLGIAGRINYIWNTECASSYDIVVVFAQKYGERLLYLVNSSGLELFPPFAEYEYDYPTGNPGNDMDFVRRLRKEFSDG